MITHVPTPVKLTAPLLMEQMFPSLVVRDNGRPEEEDTLNGYVGPPTAALAGAIGSKLMI
jgi:hypothetical protein